MNKKIDEYRGAGVEAGEAGSGGFSLRGLRTFESFKIPVFRLYFSIMAGHWISMNMQIITRSLLIYRLTESGAILGAMSLASAIPMLTLSLIGGAMADRIQKKFVLLAGQAASAVVALSIALALTLGYLSKDVPGSWWILVVSAVVQGSIMGLMMPSRQAIIPEIVGPERLMNAISLNMLGMNMFQILAPAAAGFLIDIFDFNVVYFITTGLYSLATIGVFFLPRFKTTPAQGSGTLREVLDGVRYIRREKTILLVLVFVLVTTVFGMPHRMLLPMFTEDIFGVGGTGLGLLMSISGIGALVASTTLASLPNRKRGRLLLIGGLILGFALLGFAFSRWWFLSLFLMFLVGLGDTGQRALGNTLIQSHVDAQYRGRVMSFFMMGFGLGSLGTFFGGLLAEAAGVQWSIGGLAIALTVVALLILSLSPRLRKLE
ncbi:MAG: MFS transporter [Chloroflexota bacterium]